jgi:hypothetical protein
LSERLFAGMAPMPCAGDVDGDNVVTMSDLNATLSGFGAVGAGLSADTNGDGVVNFGDLNGVLANFGAECE